MGLAGAYAHEAESEALPSPFDRTFESEVPTDFRCQAQRNGNPKVEQPLLPLFFFIAPDSFPAGCHALARLGVFVVGRIPRLRKEISLGQTDYFFTSRHGPRRDGVGIEGREEKDCEGCVGSAGTFREWDDAWQPG